MFRHGLMLIIFLFPTMTGMAGESRVYDRLPRRLAEMDRYERMAMEPYPNYDTMPLPERAALYARQFEFMRDRKPVFSPETLDEIERAKKTPRARREDFYKPPAPKKPKAPAADDLSSLAGPWSANKAPEPAPPPSEPRDYRMETLRRGVNMMDLIKEDR